MKGHLMNGTIVLGDKEKLAFCDVYNFTGVN